MPHRQNVARSAGTFVLLIALLLFGLVTAPVSAAPKTDVVVLLNGDRITGEFKELAYGQLKFKTDDMGTLAIEWYRIGSVTTKQMLQLELEDGTRIIGSAPEPGSRPGVIRIESKPGEPPSVTEVSLWDVVRGASFSESGRWRERLDGSVSLGYSYTKASDIAVTDFAANVGRRKALWRWDVDLEAQLTSQKSGPSSQRDGLQGVVERFLPDRYYFDAGLQFARNQELGLDLRTLIGGSAGRYLVQRPGREWRAGGGLAVSTEQGSDGVRRNVIWAQVGSALSMYRYKTPEMNISAFVSVLPSLNEAGRVRLEAGVKARYELLKDFFFELSFNDSYDNQPAETTTTNDWNLTMGLGYTF